VAARSRHPARELQDRLKQPVSPALPTIVAVEASYAPVTPFVCVEVCQSGPVDYIADASGRVGDALLEVAEAGTAGRMRLRLRRAGSAVDTTSVRDHLSACVALPT
jgi:hypothetical protein